ncbi:MAG: hypothetical protein KKF48_01970 [Nanoarchaeota archaeon]|nr:hypothetical protein [Nanoarchaeota archaeon]MBU1027787.1 hypothetical protein [Nanoarchaeota archaeon]
MGTDVSHNGKFLGRFRSDPFTSKLNFIAENFECLELLLSLSPSSEIDIKDEKIMTYREFRKERLSKINGFYPNLDSWIFKNYKRYERDIK